ncbi:MAG: hypothetical protein M1830_001811 [Pleopsidium flavum]|nr:MAG: hypothetical protein M1830_001811 [Pleopsidium flavum]
MDREFQERLVTCRTSVARIYSMLQTSPDEWESYVGSARSVMASIDVTPFMADPNKIEEQIWIIEGLQKLAFRAQGSGGLSDVADWCLRQWLSLLHNHPENIDALKGLGQAWLSRAQTYLGRIHREDSSSSSGFSQPHNGVVVYTSSDEERDAAAAAVEADARLHTADYVEARGMLLPAVEYFQRAVRAAELQRVLSGDLLALAAEAHISLGNVSYSTTNERLFHQALEYLRKTTQIPGFLDEYGRLEH